MEVLSHGILLIRRQRLKLLPAFSQVTALIGRQIVPTLKTLLSLSALPRGTGALGFYEKPEQRVPIKSMRVAADVPASQRAELEVLRTDTPTFTAYVEARRNRREEWFKVPAGHVDVCNVPIPVRPKPSH